MNNFAQEGKRRMLLAVVTVGTSIAAILGSALVLSTFYSYTMDDSFITFRYAENFLNGGGLVFNAAEIPRSEGLTSPLYAVIVAGIAAFGIPMVTGAKALGIATHIVASLLGGLLSVKLVRSLRWVSAEAAIPFGLFVGTCFLLNPLAVANGVSGMETSLGVATFAAFLLAVWRSLDRCNVFDPPAIALLATCVPMLRPEMTIAVLTVLACVASLRPTSRRTMALAAILFLALGTSYFLFRYRYYGLPLPLPFYIKQGDSSFRGLEEVYRYIRHNLLLFVLVPVAVQWAILHVPSDRRTKEVTFLLALATAAGAQLFYYTTIAHIMGFGQRFFQPISVALLVLAAVGAARLSHRVSGAPALRLGIIFVMVGGVVYSLFASWHGKDAKRIREYAPLEQRLVNVARAIAEVAKANPFTLALNDCGAIPFYSRITILDLAGLNNRNIARSLSSVTVLEEIQRVNPDLVFLVSREKAAVVSLYGYERIEEKNLLAAGYERAGFITIGPKYHYVAYKSSASNAGVAVSRLAKMSILKASE